MAVFKTVDLLKRNNASILLDIVAENGIMTVGKKSTGLKAMVTSLMVGLSLCFDKDTLCEYCETVRGTPPTLLVDETWLPITRFFKDSRFVPKPRSKAFPDVRDKEFQQRQEKSLVDAINSWAEPIPVDNFAFRLTSATRAPDFGPHGKENLVDVVVQDETNFSYNVSCKMTKAADLGGGGYSGMMQTVPELINRFYSRVQTDLVNLGFVPGQAYQVELIPPLLYRIPYPYAVKMFRGCESVGGTIDYFYVGPDEVKYDGVKFNGSFIPIEAYAKKKPYYLRLRKKNVFDHSVKINFDKMTPTNRPYIFSSGSGDMIAARLVVDDRLPATAKVRNLW